MEEIDVNEIFDEVVDEPIDDFVEEPIKVYIKVNDKNEVIEVASSIFISDYTGYKLVDQGYGDKYAHAQSQYLDRPLINEEGKYNYIFVNGNIETNL